METGRYFFHIRNGKLYKDEMGEEHRTAQRLGRQLNG